MRLKYNGTQATGSAHVGWWEPGDEREIDDELGKRLLEHVEFEQIMVPAKNPEPLEPAALPAKPAKGGK